MATSFTVNGGASTAGTGPATATPAAGATTAAVVFTNQYDPAPTGTVTIQKLLSGGGTLPATTAKFTFHIAFGIFWTGLGGMVGLHHRSDVDALTAGMRTGALDDVLFPENPVADAPRIINRYRTLFPVMIQSWHRAADGCCGKRDLSSSHHFWALTNDSRSYDVTYSRQRMSGAAARYASAS